MILPPGQTKGKIQSNGKTREVKEEPKKVERIVPIVLNGREEGRSRSREKVSNPFLAGNKGSEGLKSKQEKERVSNGTLSSPTKIAPLATAEVFCIIFFTYFCSLEYCFGHNFNNVMMQTRRCNEADPSFILVLNTVASCH